MPKPIINLSVARTAIEGSIIGSYIITLSTPAPVGGLTVNFDTIGSTATLDSDYNFTLGTNLTALTGNSFTIAEGATTATLNLVAHNDADVDPNETVKLNITAGTGYDLFQFSPSSIYPTGVSTFPSSVNVGDLNGDGNLDIAVIGGYSLSVFMRNAANTDFEPVVRLGTGSGFMPNSVGIGDFNGDGKLDLAVAAGSTLLNGGGTSSANSITILLRNATNTGYDIQPSFLAGYESEGLTVGDFNGDGLSDFATVNLNNTLSVFMRNAANTGFDARVDYATGNFPKSLTVGDFNGDGKLDLAVAVQGSGKVGVFLRNATNTGFDTRIDYAAGVAPWSVNSGDFNGDGQLDLAVTDTYNNGVWVLQRNAANTGFDPAVLYAVGVGTNAVSVADVNGDDKLDLIVQRSTSVTPITVLLRNAANTGFDSGINILSGLSVGPVATGDFNKDGKIDLAVPTTTGTHGALVLTNASNPSATLSIEDNVAPTDLSISSSNINENVAANSLIGTLSTTDSNANNSFTYSLAAGGDNDAFTIVGNQLKINHPPDFETKSSYNITVRSTDEGDLFLDKTLTITINDLNEVPTDLSISTNTINENVAVGSVVGTLSSTDPDAGNTFTYSLVAGGIDNAAFSIVGNQLKIKVSPNYEAKSSYSIKVRTTDQSGLFFNKVLSIGINNLLDTPVVLNIPSAINYVDTAFDDTFVVKTGALSATADMGATLTYGITGGSLNGSGWLEKTNGYGKLEINPSTGAYRFSPDDTKIEPLGVPITDTSLQVTVSDGIATVNQTFTVKINQSGITETNGNNNLTGTLGADHWAGLQGNDTYTVNHLNDTITEQTNEGIDTIVSSISYTLPTNVENLTLTGIANINATGNADNNKLIGNAGNNILDGKAGIDTLIGGAGNDTYYVDNSSDVITETGNSLFDMVYSSVTYTLSTNIYGLILQGTDNINAKGNIGNNLLVGNTGNNVLDTGGGIDLLKGGLGNDTYIINNASTVIQEKLNEGTDSVLAYCNGYTLAANLENLNLATGYLSGTGNALNNTLTGNALNNILNGATGIDTLIGGLGNDTYYVDNPNDRIIENNGEGYDSVYSSVSYTLAANVEQLQLQGIANINATGNADNNKLIGNAGNNILDGKAGIDTLIGGAGNDTYYVDNSSDVIIETANSFYDKVYATASYTLSTNIYSLTLQGTDNINAKGNIGNNLLVGNAGNNVLDTGGGTDVLIGGNGNDTYIINNANTVIIEHANSGTDTVIANFNNYTLDDALENLTIGTTYLSGTGNDLDNTLTGNAANNLLDGGAGSDTLIGGEGTDTLIGGTGSDLYRLTETTAATDTVRIAAGESDTINFDRVENFNLGTGSGTTGVDRLDLDSALIASNTTGYDGIDANTIKSHSITNGIISFDTVDTYTAPVTITTATNLSDVLSYLQQNIIDGDTVAFVAEADTYVFQADVTGDTLVELIGVSATQLDSTGSHGGAVWLV